MAIELIGKDAVSKYIKLSGKRCFEIYRDGSNGNNYPVYEYEGQDSTKAAQQFEEWATISDNNGQNWQPYKIVVCDILNPGMDKEKQGIKRQNTMSTTFALNAQGMGSMGAPGQQPTVAKDAAGNIYFIGAQPGQQKVEPIVNPNADMTKFVAKADLEQAIVHALANQQKDFQIQQLAATIARLEDRLDDYEEEEEEEEEKKLSGEKAWTPDVVKGLIDTAKTTYLDIKGAHDGSKVVKPLNQVAAPQTQEVEPTVVTIPEGAEPGKYPPFVTLTEANKDLVKADQQLKLQAAIARIYAKDVHIGDDLLIIAGIAENKPNRFNGLIASLREE